jgi:hypothetical protein
MIHLSKIVPALLLFLRYIVPFIRWATNALQDRKVTVDEVVAATYEFWPKKDASGNPLPINVPWFSKNERS